MKHPHDFNQICAPLRRPLLARAMRLTRNKHDAEDLVQDAMMRAFQVWDTFDAADRDPRARASTWLYQIMLNAFRSQWRTRAFQAEAAEYRDADVLSATMAEEPYDNPGELLGLGGYLDYVDDGIREAVECLEPIHRDVILRIARGEDDVKIAAELGLDRRTIRSRLSRARSRLVEQLDAVG